MLTVAAVAEAKGLSPQKIDVRIVRETNQGTLWQTDFVVQVSLGEGLTSREKTILFNSARRCEVHKLLSGKIAARYELTEP